MLENTEVLKVVDFEDFTENSISTEVTREKPFNKCLHCEYFRNGCSGPNLNAMSVERACEFLQICRKQLGYSYQKTADVCMLSVVTVKRILTGQVKDPGFLSMQALTFALVSDPNGKHPCAMHILSKETEQAITDCKVAQETLARREKEFRHELEAEQSKVGYLLKQIEFKDSQMQAKDRLLEERYEFLKRKDKSIAILSVMLAIAVLIIFAALVVDRFNSDVGFFWIDRMFSRSSALWSSVQNIL